MKLQIAAGLALAGMSATAWAQSSVTLYGIVDTGIEYVSHADAAGDSVVRMPGITGEVPSRWGLRGKEDLGGGLSAIFALESGFNMRSGTLNQGGRLFGRQAWVGLSSPYGNLTFGRQYTMTYWALADADLLGPDIYGGTASFDQYLPSARSDNTIVYKGELRRLHARRDMVVRPRFHRHRQLARPGHLRGTRAGQRADLPRNGRRCCATTSTVMAWPRPTMSSTAVQARQPNLYDGTPNVRAKPIQATRTCACN